MKWVVGSLLLLNLGYFSWQQFSVGEEHARTQGLPPGAKQQLLMVSEHRPEAEPVSQQAVKKVSPPQAKEDVVSKPVAQAEPTPEVTPEPVKIAAVTPMPQPKPVAKPVVAEKPAPKSVAVPRPVPEVKTRVAPKACFSIGPFLLVSDVSKAAKSYNQPGMATQQRAASEKKEAGFWVFVPPQASLSVARAVLRDLQDRKVSEVLIISEGEKANAISAGVYYSHQQALKRQEEIASLGYMAQVEQLYRTQPQYWLDLELMSSTQIPNALWQKTAQGFPNISQSARRCE